MLDDGEHGGGRLDNPLCRLCTRKDGTPLTFEEAVSSHAFWLQSKAGVPPGQALEAAREILEGNPAWEDGG
jgi:hypothetical protein